MIKIRLSRGGTRNKPFYQIVAIDERKKNKARYLQILGIWHPAKKLFTIKKELLAKWVKVGAQISPSLKKLLDQNEKTA